VSTLNQDVPYDWKSFLNKRLYSTDFHAPLEGIDRSGWRLVYTEQESPYLSDLENVRSSLEFGYSIGLRMDGKGMINDVIEGMPAAKAGLGPGMRVMAVNGQAFTPQALHDAIASTKAGANRIMLTIDNGGAYQDFTIQYQGGEKYPVLEKIQGKPDLLSLIIAPRTR
jgi:predicted metalloprotease with PDZ domain